MVQEWDPGIGGEIWNRKKIYYNGQIGKIWNRGGDMGIWIFGNTVSLWGIESDWGPQKVRDLTRYSEEIRKSENPLQDTQGNLDTLIWFNNLRLMFSKLCYSLCDDEDHCPLNPKSPVKKKDSKEETVSRIDDRARSYKGDVIYGDVSHQEKDQRGARHKVLVKACSEADTGLGLIKPSTVSVWNLGLLSVNLIFWIMMNCAFVDGQSRVLGCYDWINGYIWFMGFWFMLKTYRTVSQLSLLQLVSLNQLQIRELELRKAFWTVQVLLWDGSGLRYIMTILRHN
ncbi:hypothetical protein F2Q68_00014913 [Brassica cretica]|uniref:Uncharacterized protein n=1 Tax=Brassica cretica TaxID=69181 RepID=A0A8S9HNE4_BRACR|nr:hypothetical protein F2Q68_00014913 [Brassica cretica]